MQRVPGNVRRREAFDGPATLARFFKGERLETMPAKGPDRLAVLTYIAERFTAGRAYDEGEVNRVLAAMDNDFATLRRYLIDAGLLQRHDGIYRRT